MQSSQQIKSDLDQAVAELQTIPQSVRNLWTCGTGIRRLVDEKSEAILALMRNRHGDPRHVNETLNFVFSELRSHQELAGLKTHADFLTGTAEFLEAEQLVRPIVERIHALEADLREAIDEENRAEQARLEQLEAAKAAAVAAIEAEFAKPEPAPQEPARPFRGKGIKPSSAVTETLDLAEPSFT